MPAYLAFADLGSNPHYVSLSSATWPYFLSINVKVIVERTECMRQASNRCSRKLVVLLVVIRQLDILATMMHFLFVGPRNWKIESLNFGDRTSCNVLLYYY